MIFASYGRKSIYSDHSDSVKNQHRMNRDYVDMHFPGKIDTFLTYEDEGATGANTNRPDLKRLMRDIESGIINFLIVYQLDRLSRDVRDFSNIYAFLEEHNVQFVSVKENIDTSTPIGKAMMYVSVVFAQMERETIANRVNDNMIGLADEGWWVGGNPPSPYRRLPVITSDGKKHVTIEVVEEEMPEFLELCNIFLDNHFSLQQFETYLKNKGVKTRNGKFYATNQLHKLLTMPYCAPATAEVYDYYKELGCNMSERYPREMWTGEYGVMVYGRTTERNKKHELQPKEKWRVCIGRHKPCIDANTWLRIQKQFTHNVFDKKMRHPVTLLKGVLRCSCGRLMSLSRKKKVDGSVSTWYCCPRRMRQGKEYCNSHQIKAELLDQKVIEIFNQIAADPETINLYMRDNRTNKDIKLEKSRLEKQALSLKEKISNLTVTLADNQDTSAIKYIIQGIEKMDNELKSIDRKIAELQAEERFAKEASEDSEEKRNRITEFMKDFENFSPEERNAIAKDFIKECTWDGHTLFLML